MHTSHAQEEICHSSLHKIVKLCSQIQQLFAIRKLRADHFLIPHSGFILCCSPLSTAFNQDR